jgi:hypothetical protein
MFEKLGRYAETVATSAGQSRRGFLGLMGKGALSLAGLVGGLLLVPGEAAAAANPCKGHCVYFCPKGSGGTNVDVSCMKGCTCAQNITHGGLSCFLAFDNCTLEW